MKSFTLTLSLISTIRGKGSRWIEEQGEGKERNEEDGAPFSSKSLQFGRDDVY